MGATCWKCVQRLAGPRAPKSNLLVRDSVKDNNLCSVLRYYYQSGPLFYMKRGMVLLRQQHVWVGPAFFVLDQLIDLMICHYKLSSFVGGIYSIYLGHRRSWPLLHPRSQG